jgi:predicted GIY-YIG superfamily endonuclease
VEIYFENELIALTSLKNKCGVYEILLKDGEYRYIGSSVDLKNRFKQHRAMLENGCHENDRLQKIYNKYGLDYVNIIHFFDTRDDALTVEQIAIDFYGIDNLVNISSNAFYPETGLEIAIHQISLDDETIINTFKGMKIAANELNITYQGIQDAVNKPHRQSHGFRWCKVSDYEHLKEQYMTQYVSQIVAVYQIDINNNTIINKFDSQKEAAKSLGTHQSSLQSACNKYNRSGAGYRWCSVKRYEELKEEYNKPLPIGKQIRSINLETNEIVYYNSIKEASENLGCRYDKISLCLTKKKKTYKKRIWEYA